jgi:outer membrane scaffolding protein for murein synthesis (MipA/OmpV family)
MLLGGLLRDADAQQAAEPLWEIGVLGLAVAQPAYPGAAARTSRALALPYLIYRGEWLRADSGGAAVRAIKTPRLELDLGFSGAFGASSQQIEARQGMPDLGTLVEFGPRLKWHLGEGEGQRHWRVELPLRGVFDLNHQFAHKGLSFEPELVFERRNPVGWSFNTVASLVWGDQRLADTFYGVAPGLATGQRPAYAAQGGLIAQRLSLGVWQDLTPRLRLFGLLRFESVHGAANLDSPLLKKRSDGLLLLGLKYSWKQSDRAGTD